MARACTPYLDTDLDESPLVLVAAGPVELAWFFIYNNDSAAGFVQLFDAASIGDVTLGSTAPSIIIGIAATNWAQGALAIPMIFTKGIVSAFTSDLSNGGTGSTAVVNFGLRRG
jgi:hypothetical protein